MVERIVLLLSYLIKMTRITTTTIAIPTPPLHPAIGSMLLSYLIKMTRITTTTIATTTPPIPPAIVSMLLV
jgi:hypothetical protein